MRRMTEGMNRSQLGRELIRAGFRKDRSSAPGTFRKAIGKKGWQLRTLVPERLDELRVTLHLDEGRARGTLFRIRDANIVDVVLEYIETETQRLLADDERLLKCPWCLQYMSVKEGPNGVFLGCDNWRPEGQRESWHCDGRGNDELVPAERVWP